MKVVPWPPAEAERYRAAGLWRGETLPAWFQGCVARGGERTALVDGARRVSYRELADGVSALATGLSHLGVNAGDRVVLQLSNGLELLESLLALLHVGAVPVLALPAHRRTELEAFASLSEARALIAETRGPTALSIASAVRESCPSLEHVIVHGARYDFAREFTSLSELARQGEALARVPAHEGRASDLAVLQLSGGSHATPKLVPRTHDDYLCCVRESAALCGLSESTRYLAVLPMSHNFTLSSPGVLGTLHAGGTVVTSAQPSPEAVLGLLLNEGITLTSALPSMVRAWLEARSHAARAVELSHVTVQVGGAKLERALGERVLRELGVRLQQVFGMAEGLLNYTRLDDPEALVLDTQGRPLSPFDEVRVIDPLDPEGPELPPGAIGELVTRGPYTIRGYYDDRASDARHFTRDGSYRTGDLVRRLASGHFVVEGRLGERISRAGEKIAPEEVEMHLRAHPLVREAAVVGVPDAALGQRSLAYLVVGRRVHGPTKGQVHDFLRGRGLPDFKLPDAVHVVDELPRTQVGKTDRSALRRATPTP